MNAGNYLSREQAGLRGFVQRVETNAYRVIQWTDEPSRENEWLDEISIYSIEGNLLEWYSPENQLLEQESILHRFVYDGDGELVEKRGYGEDGTVEDVTKYYYDEQRKQIKSVHTDPTGVGGSCIFYDHKGNVARHETYDSRDGSLSLIRVWHYTYKEEANKLDASFYVEEGNPSRLRRELREHRTVTTYDESGNKIRVERYFNDWIEQIENYDAKGQLIDRTLYGDRERVAWQQSHSYDESGNLVEMTFREGSNIKVSRSEHDEWNNLTKMSSYENGILGREELYSYEYDSQNNWTKCIESVTNNNGFRSTTEYIRKLSYFR